MRHSHSREPVSAADDLDEIVLDEVVIVAARR
jgi:hypothetical protein